MEAHEAFTQLQLHFVDPMQWRYELIRPLVLLPTGTAAQRAQETGTHPDTVRALTRRFQHQGMLGLLPGRAHEGARHPGRHVPAAVVEEVARLKALNPDFHYREVVRIIWHTCGYRIAIKTVKPLWEQSAPAAQGEFAFGDYHSDPDRAHARLEVIRRYAQGWTKQSISRVLHVSRPTVHAWIQRFEAEDLAGLVDKSRAPKVHARKVWFPLMQQVYQLQKHHPDAGSFRIWSLLGRTDISVRTVGRIMALNKRLYTDIPHVPQPGRKPLPQPYKASHPHHYWFIDGRQMDCALDGVKWWSILI